MNNEDEVVKAAPQTVRTVLGDINPDLLGRTNYHEHLFHKSPLLVGDDLDDEHLSGCELRALGQSGFDSMVDATPIGLGRSTEALARLSNATGVAVIAATGRHRDAHYAGNEWITYFGEEQWTEIFVRELCVGMANDDDSYRTTAIQDVKTAKTGGGENIRAGFIKVGIDYWNISTDERQVLAAASRAHLLTGAPIMVHTEYCTAALEVLDIFAGHGVTADRVVIAHADKNPDAGLHASIAERGAYLGYDGAGRHKDHPDSLLITTLTEVVERGHADRILVGADVARRSRFQAYGGMPGLAYLGASYIPRVEQSIGTELLNQILVVNPARFFTLS